MIDKRKCDKGFIWNPNNCECECDRSCDVGEHIDYKNSKRRKTLIDKLVEENCENIDEKKLNKNKMIYNSNLNDYEKICGFCKVYIIMFVIVFIISISISCILNYSHWCLKI